MANPEHVEILRKGVKAWNGWRKRNPSVQPDLKYIHFVRDHLLWMELNGANLSRVDLRGAFIAESHFIGANLSGANLSDTTIDNVILNNANLSGADFSGAVLTFVNLNNANLRRTIFSATKLSMTTLTGAVFDDAYIGFSSFSNVDLSPANGLERVRFGGPSSIGVDTVYRSRGNISKEFLRNCGVPDSFINQIPMLVAEFKPIQFFSCFISYSSRDQEFANKIHTDLQSRGVSCWFAPDDLKIGEKFRVRIDETIRLYDKLLVVLSRNSVSSPWVEKEVETAMEKEREQGKVVLIPIRLDEAVNEIKTGWPADIRRTRFVGDFSDWKNQGTYRKIFARLIRDLKAEARREA